MIDVLLAHAFYLRFDPKQWRACQPYAPLGTMYAASYLRQQGFRAGLFDSMLAREPADLLPVLHKQRPRLVVFHEDNFNWLSKMCLVRMRQACFEMIRLVKSTLGDHTPVVVAGSDATDRQDIYFDHGADFVVVGESELTLHDLATALLKERSFEVRDIHGLAYRSNGSIAHTPPRRYLKNLDVLPFPAWDLIDVEAYRRAWNKKHGYYSVNLVTTRGCPFRCNWCAKPIYGNRYNSRSPENVVEEMLWLREHVRPDHIWFADDIFGLKPGWVEHFADAVEQAGLRIPFKIQARVDLLHDAVIAALKRAGCRTVWVGAESGSQKILDAMDKGTKVEQIYRVTKVLKRHGIQVCFFLQFGYPGETEADIEKTLQMVRDCAPDDIGISVSYPLPGTKFYERVRTAMGAKQNWEHSDDLDLMFAGQYQPAFYRQLHRVVHQRFRLQKARSLLATGWRHPRYLSAADWRFILSTCLRAPTLMLAQHRLNRLKQPNQNRPVMKTNQKRKECDDYCEINLG